MMGEAFPIANLIDQLSRLPGIGKKTAQRLAYFILDMEGRDVQKLAEALTEAKERIHFCAQCGNFTEEELCSICRDEQRDASVICVVESPRELLAIEKGGDYKGVYHVLHGTISPLNDRGPESVRARELLTRLAGKVSEVILATNPTVEGESTALYLSKLIRVSGVRVTRIAHGIPVGADLEFFDSETLKKALEHRIDFGTE